MMNQEKVQSLLAQWDLVRAAYQVALRRLVGATEEAERVMNELRQEIGRARDP